ncbi:bifunctional ADP-dependent NAD(P)H-hydrate dehydratase/NAD(P)H-hydrate epimerase [Limnospira platensis]|uniref:bifunctional ADP-dependent NAD(P)H-hydrate dehydratase/NAD(P)H-hydrate epimerase n=1 Tax=Limnospira platensis TaxID=118562 RepID=UPI0002804395|nr:carbohydrate kinase YjeF related protein [Arthrospira platensis C1]UWU48405.1 NAD(P)H-hydrate epimerase [Arthrospira platensis C1]
MAGTPNRFQLIQQFAVTAAQMQAIETRIFDAGMPVAALMEKVALNITRHLLSILHSEYTSTPVNLIGVLVGPGHNGGDALVVARELLYRGYRVLLYSPFSKHKPLTADHFRYAASLGIEIVEAIAQLADCDLIIDGMFGFGLERPIQGDLAQIVETVNSWWNKPVFSIDIPSGIHTDTGLVLGTAIRATKTFCLGLWKLAFLREEALPWLGTSELIDFDIPVTDIHAVLGVSPDLRRLTPELARSHLPIPLPQNTHKYKQGHLLIIAGSRRYTGAALLSGLGARASGVGMLSIAVPESIKPLLSFPLPEALIIGCPETDNGAIASIADHINLDSYDAIACGPGLTADNVSVIQTVLNSHRPLVLDADGLNLLAKLDPVTTLSNRQAATILTPHRREFKRLFPQLNHESHTSIEGSREAARLTGAVVILKGARTCIATAESVIINPESTPALARGGSGDVLTGLLGGILAIQSLRSQPPELSAQVAVWWHSLAGIVAASDRTELGVDAFTLTQYLNLKQLLSHFPQFTPDGNIPRYNN